MRPPAKKARRPKGAAATPATAPSASGSGSGDAVLQRALSWLNSYPKVSRWMAQYDIEELIERGGGICRVDDFLPPFVAEGALRILERLPSGRWRPTEADEDYTHNNIAHAFWSVKGGGQGGGGGSSEELEALLRAFTLLRPEQLHAFSAARYDRDHHIAPHDDRAYTPVRLDTGEVVTCSRDLTVIYYLTKDWEESMGGVLVDLEAEEEAQEGQQEGKGRQQEGGRNGSSGSNGQRAAPASKGRAFVPRFNSAVFFRVPRYHAVTPLTTDRPRYTVFGWFLQPGQLYDLFTGEEEAQQAHQGEQQDERQQRGRGQGNGLPRQLPAPALERVEGEDGEAAAARNGRRRKKQRRLQEEANAEQQADEAAEAASAAQHCKLAQRLLAKVAARQQRRQ